MMRSNLIILLVLLCAMTAASSQDQPQTSAAQAVNKAYSPQLLRELAALREAALGDDYAYQQVAHLTENIGPRPPGSPRPR
jgi:hypothetical protein